MVIRCSGLGKGAGGLLVGMMLWQGGPLQATPNDVSALLQPPNAGNADISFFRDPGRADLGEHRHMLIEDRALFISKVFVTYSDIRCGGANTIEVHGENFLGPEDVFIGLGNKGPLALCRAAKPDLLLGELPPELASGSFVLSVSRGTATTDFDLFDLAIGPEPVGRQRRDGVDVIWNSAEFGIEAPDTSRRVLHCPSDHPQVLTGGFQFVGRHAAGRAQVSRPIRGTRPLPDGWEVGVDLTALENDGGQYLQLSINIVCSR